MGLQYHSLVQHHVTKDDLDRMEQCGLAGAHLDHVSAIDLSPADIVREYKATGRFVNLDYPGGIDQFVRDFEAGKLNRKPL